MIISRELEALRVPVLTHREKEVVSLILEGASNADISKTLGISGNTTKAHLKSVFNSVGCSTRTELASMIQAHLEQTRIPMHEHRAVVKRLKRRIRGLKNQMLWGGWNG